MKKSILIFIAVLLSFSFAQANHQGIQSSGKISDKGKKALIMKYEGCRLTAYRCPAGVWTIGVGNTRHAKPGLVTTKTQALIWLSEDCQRFENYLNKVVKRGLKIHEFDALGSLTFNCGSGVLKGDFLQAVNAGATNLVISHIKLHCKARAHTPR